MSRTLLAWSLLGLVVVSSGCAMCDSPYDYSGPTAGPGESCNPMARSGSILSPSLSPVAYEGAEGVIEGGQPTVAPVPTQAAPEPTEAPLAPEPSAAIRPARSTRAMAQPHRHTKASAMARYSRPSHASSAPGTRTRTRPNPSEVAGANFFPGIPPENILSITDRRLEEVEGQADEATVSAPQSTSQPAKAAVVQSTPEPPQETKAPVVLSKPAESDAPVKQTGGWVARGTIVRP